MRKVALATHLIIVWRRGRETRRRGEEEEGKKEDEGERKEGEDEVGRERGGDVS